MSARRGERGAALESMRPRALALLVACLSACSDTSASTPGLDAATGDGGQMSGLDGSVLRPDGGALTTGDGGAIASSDGGFASDGAAPDAAVVDPGTLAKFSFFVTSFEGMQRLSKSADGFGGDLRYGETGDGAGLRGADKICAELAEGSMPGAAQKGWHAFLSTSTVSAKDRVGQGPWYDRRGRLLAQNLIDLLNTRPTGADSAIANDFPNETGTPNHNPDGKGEVDNHDVLTGSNAQGMVYGTDPGAHCNDWTSAARSGKPRVGHSWPRSGPGGGFGGFIGGGGGGDMDMNNWMSALNEAGCAPGASLMEMGPPNADNPTVGSGGGYGAIYCFALTP